MRWKGDKDRAHVCARTQSCLTLQPPGLYPARLLRPWEAPGKNPGVGCHFLLQGIFPTQGSNLHLLPWQADSLPLSHQSKDGSVNKSCPPLASRWTVAHQAPLSMGFSRQEHCSGLPFPSPGDLPDPGISMQNKDTPVKISLENRVCFLLLHKAPWSPDPKPKEHRV